MVTLKLNNEANYTKATEKDICIALDALENTASGKTELDMQSADILCGFLNKAVSQIAELQEKLSVKDRQIVDLKKMLILAESDLSNNKDKLSRRNRQIEGFRNEIAGLRKTADAGLEDGLMLVRIIKVLSESHFNVTDTEKLNSIRKLLKVRTGV